MARWNKSVLNPEQQRSLKREVLYQVAAAAFRRNGYHGTSLVDIAETLGVSKATLYYYVKNKQDLLFQCHMAAADQALATICTDPSLNGLEQLRRSLAAYIVSIIGEGSFSVVILEERSLSDEQLRVVIEKRDIFERRLQDVVRTGVTDGSILRCDPKFAVFSALGAANWVTKWHRPEGAWTIDEIAEASASLLCRGLAAGPVPGCPSNRLYGGQP
ncbi:MAG TPA: TetR/AcrR family transcriptional regulator [Azospirillum sp.]|nr:TetR/AcrR family transcriptional regulator [Azospirillum sp.]